MQTAELAQKEKKVTELLARIDEEAENRDSLSNQAALQQQEIGLLTEKVASLTSQLEKKVESENIKLSELVERL